MNRSEIGEEGLSTEKGGTLVLLDGGQAPSIPPKAFLLGCIRRILMFLEKSLNHSSQARFRSFKLDL